MNRINYTAGGRLSIWDTINTVHRITFLKKLFKIIKQHSHASIETDDLELHETHDESLVALTAILDKYIARGCPTLVRLDFENRLLEFAELVGIHSEEISNSRQIGRRIVNLPEGINFNDLIKNAYSQSYLRFSDNLIKHQNNQPLPQNLKNLTSPEEDIFFNEFGKIFSKPLQALLQRQQLISDLIGCEDPMVLNNKVDFSFKVGNLQLVFEIDGTQHDEEPDRLHDEERDAILLKAGWKVFRIHANLVPEKLHNHQLLEFDSKLNEKEREDFWSIKNNIEENLLENEIDSPSFLTLLLPHYVHRCLRGLIQIIRMADVSVDKPLKILAIEEDIVVIPEAFYQLMTIWKHLHIIAPDTQPPPTIEIHVIGGKPLIDIPQLKNLHVTYIDEAKGEFDLIISNSITLFSGQKGLREKDVLRTVSGKCIQIRTAPINREYRSLQWSLPIKFELDDLEEALISQSTDNPLLIPEEKYDSLMFFLHDAFRKSEFWEGQARVISRLLMGKHSIVLLPTGGGKSLTYQFAGLLLPGVTLIVDPLVSLMSDQVENLKNMGFDKCGFISSLLDADARDVAQSELENGEMYYVFVAPERMQMENFRTSLQTVVNRMPISLAVIDEAHCVSEWGHNFRTSYLHLSHNITKYCSPEIGGRPPTLAALTGTASFAVLTDIQMEIAFKDDNTAEEENAIMDENAIILPKSFDRRELIFTVVRTIVRQKSASLNTIKQNLHNLLNRNPQNFFNTQGDNTNSGIIFCPYVNGHFGVHYIANNICGHGNYYSGKKPRFEDMDYNEWKEYKIEIQRRFKYNEIQEIVATKAMGMGIDKPNIRYSIHYTIPSSVEAFYQEAGRAGRDGVPDSAYCFIIYSDDNWETAQDILNESNHETATERLNGINRRDRGDLLVQLWLLLDTFKSRDNEKLFTFDFWQTLLAPAVENLNPGGTNSVSIRFGGDNERGKNEKAIYRLVLLGAVEEYSVDWQNRVFNVTVRKVSANEVKVNLRKYFRNYKFEQIADEYANNIPEDSIENALQHAISKVIDFVYDEIVAKRKQALRSIAEYSRSYTDSDSFKANILSYLQESEFSEELRGWINKPYDEIGIDRIKEILEEVEDLEQARRLVGTCRRMLDEDPSNIALRLLSAGARIRSNTESDDSAKGESLTLVKQIADSYENISNPERILIEIVLEIQAYRERLLPEILDNMLRQIGTRKFIRIYFSVINQIPDIDNYKNMLNILAGEALKTVKSLKFYRNL